MLSQHEKTHTGGKPYQCNICDKFFVTSDELRIHKKIHYEQKQKDKKEQMKRVYQCNKGKIAKLRAEKRATETEKDRFQKFKKDVRNCRLVGCICFNKMSTTSSIYYNGGIEKLKAELEEKKQGLFDKCIFRPIPRELNIDENIFLCTSCEKRSINPL